eukprot:CFRG0045T1
MSENVLPDGPVVVKDTLLENKAIVGTSYKSKTESATDESTTVGSTSNEGSGSRDKENEPATDVTSESAKEPPAEAEGEGGDEDDEDKEEEDILPPDVIRLPPQYRSFKPNITPEEGEKMSLLLESFSEEQMSRYESYRRAGFPRAAMKRLMTQITGSTVPPTAVIVMSGITKIFCGEVIEAASSVQAEWGGTGALRPKHIREGLRRLRSNGSTTVTGLKPFKRRRLD